MADYVYEGLRQEMTETLRRWIRVPSVKDEPQPGAPFGAEVRRALDIALEDARKMGFEVRDIDGYAGDVRMGALGVEPLAILAHLDVVPAGDGWTRDPFGAEIEGDRMYGRGTSDDKGPAVAALYAMYALHKAGVALKREVRLILGCDEESGWEDIQYYSEHIGMPRTGFSPDASFPVINTEKGMLHISLRAPYTKDGLRVKEICVGERCNVIPGAAAAIVFGGAELADKVAKLADENKWQVSAETLTDGTVRIASLGVPGHAAYPEDAKNALGQLMAVLGALGAAGGLKAVADCVGMEYDGASLGIGCSDKTSGPLTCNLGILRYNEEDGLYATLDIRYPILANPEALTRTLTAAFGGALDVTVDSQKEPHHVAPNSSLVTALLDAYHDETGRPRACVATGGGTYARSLEEGVAFGGAFPEDQDLAHQAGEYLSLDGLMANVRIYMRAILNLAG